MSSSLVQHLQSRAGAKDVAALLAETVVFRSPVAEYHGRPVVAHLLATIAAVLEDVTPTRTIEADEATTTFLTASVEGHALDGVLDERHDADGRVVQATLFMRPYAALRVSIGQMQARLEADPLPGGGA